MSELDLWHLLQFTALSSDFLRHCTELLRRNGAHKIPPGKRILDIVKYAKTFRTIRRECKSKKAQFTTHANAYVCMCSPYVFTHIEFV